MSKRTRSFRETSDGVGDKILEPLNLVAAIASTISIVAIAVTYSLHSAFYQGMGVSLQSAGGVKPSAVFQVGVLLMLLALFPMAVVGFCWYFAAALIWMTPRGTPLIGPVIRRGLVVMLARSEPRHADKYLRREARALDLVARKRSELMSFRGALTAVMAVFMLYMISRQWDLIRTLAVSVASFTMITFVALTLIARHFSRFLIVLSAVLLASILSAQEVGAALAAQVRLTGVAPVAAHWVGIEAQLAYVAASPSRAQAQLARSGTQVIVIGVREQVYLLWDVCSRKVWSVPNFQLDLEYAFADPAVAPRC